MPAQIGSKHHAAKMTPAKVRQARKSYEVRGKDGKRKNTMLVLAERYGIKVQTMHSILHRKTWKHVI